MYKAIRFLLILVCFITVAVDLTGQDTLLAILDKEIVKIQEDYDKKEQPPYFIDLRVHDFTTSMLQYASGILTLQHQSRDRIVTTGMRIGDYMSDNTSALDNADLIDNWIPVFADKLPFENDSLAVCHSLDYSFEIAYQQALQQYRTRQKNPNLTRKRETVPSFSIEKPARYFEEPLDMLLNDSAFSTWKLILKNVSETISNEADVINSTMALMVLNERIYYLNSEGTRVVQNRPQCQIQLMVAIKTRDGTIAPVTQSYIGRNMDVLPTGVKLDEYVINLKHLVMELRDAPLADPYAGPAMLSPEAAGVLFHEIFGHRIEGQRMNSTFDSQTFMDKIGKQIIHEDITIISDPTQKEFNGIPLFGSYPYDDEGVPARAVTVVDHGILKEFLMSRIPVKGQLHSNGHGRAQVGSAPFSRQANLFIKSSGSISEPAMRKLLLRECKKQHKAYGYYIKEVFGGLTSTDLFSPQVFNILPTVVYRIYTDDRPDELVRGVSFIGTPLTVFSEIMATSDRYEVFNGYCGAESGNIPVSTISPGLLIKKLETQKMPETKVIVPKIPSPVKKK
ncbi:MAG: TldD/PmbA family protein [Bacteroidales bacterium]|nr:TldD/PmbA family protein [Bacteroidales bacterium]